MKRVHKRRMLDYAHPKRIVLSVFNAPLEMLKVNCIGMVIMPMHVHALVWFPVREQLVGFVHEWKR